MRTESKRQKQASEVIRRHFGLVLIQEGHNIYGDALVTVTNVKMTPDFGLAKIYLSIYNTPDKQEVIRLMKKNQHMLRNELARRIRKHVRRIPNIDIYEDETLDEMYRLNALFNQINKDDAAVRGEEE
jgi:ribosome-binding factor A